MSLGLPCSYKRKEEDLDTMVILLCEECGAEFEPSWTGDALEEARSEGWFVLTSVKNPGTLVYISCPECKES
jgi:hypothetical protein